MAGRKPRIDDEQILEVFIEASDPVLSAPEIADIFDFSTPGMYKRLRSLQEQGLVDSKKIGQGRAWWLTDDGHEFLESDVEG